MPESMKTKRENRAAFFSFFLPNFKFWFYFIFFLLSFLPSSLPPLTSGEQTLERFVCGFVAREPGQGELSCGWKAEAGGWRFAFSTSAHVLALTTTGHVERQIGLGVFFRCRQAQVWALYFFFLSLQCLALDCLLELDLVAVDFCVFNSYFCLCCGSSLKIYNPLDINDVLYVSGTVVDVLLIK